MQGLVVEALTRFVDPRGTLTKVMPGPVAGEVYAVTVEPGASRGHHLHPRMAESFVALRGKGTLGLLDPATGERRYVDLDGVRVLVPAGLAHALFNTGQEPLVVVALAERLHDPSDVVPCLVPPPEPAP